MQPRSSDQGWELRSDSHLPGSSDPGWELRSDSHPAQSFVHIGNAKQALFYKASLFLDPRGPSATDTPCKWATGE